MDAVRLKLDSLPKFRHVAVQTPYTYIEKINHLKATVELGFVIKTVPKQSSSPQFLYLKPRRNPLRF